MSTLDIPKKPLISVKEAVQINFNYVGISVLATANEIAEEWGERYSNPAFNHACMLAAVYTAGYIQGKREERSKKKAQRAKRQTEKSREFIQAAARAAQS